MKIGKAIDLIIQWTICIFIGFVLGFTVSHHTRTQAPPTAITATYRVTAYCPCEKCCGRFSDGITASGKPAIGKLIAAPKSIPFGTWMNIEGYGYAEVLDRGGAIKGNRLDLLFPTHQEALNWGVQYLEIEI